MWAKALYNWQCRQDDPRLQEEWQDTKEFKHRLQVNWLRHCASNYEEILDALYEMKLDCRSKYILHNILKTTVLNLISDRYPEFREACKLQFRETTRTKSSRWRQAA